MGIPVAELKPRLSAEELGQWIAFERVTGPILAHERIDVIGAQITAAIVRALGGNKDATPADFLPDWDAANKAEVEQSPEDMIATLNTFRNIPKEEG